MKKLLIVLFVGLLFGCSTNKQEVLDKTDEVKDEVNNNQLIDDVIVDKTLQLSQDELYQKFTAKIDTEIDESKLQQIYDDFDYDGTKELFITYQGVDDYFHTYVISYDGSMIQEAHVSTIYRDAYELKTIELPSQKHVVLNEFNMMGMNNETHIFKYENNQVEIIYQTNGASIYQNEDGHILFHVEDYDAMYDPTLEGYIGHSYKASYLHFDEASNMYQEYGAKSITHDEFMAYDNAQQLISDISVKLKENDPLGITYKYFVRNNQIVHIQYEMELASGYIHYGYYTLKINDNKLEMIDNECSGQMKDHFSNLEII